MPAPRPELTAADAGRHVRGRCLARAAPAGLSWPSPAEVSPSSRVGVEVEWLVHSLEDPGAPVAFEALHAATAAAGPLPAGARITFEPGGQVELSSLPQHGPVPACQAAATDLAVLRQVLAEHGLGLAGVGLDPVRPPRRVVDSPRYRAMEAYFDADGRAGRTMMCSTAAVQVNVDLGPDATSTWRLAHDLGPTLAAAFANSPLIAGGPSGWRSTRLATWWAIDPSRTRPVGVPGGEPGAAWADYALAARVMMVRLDPERFQPVLGTMSFTDWLSEGHGGAYPTAEDLDYHLTTLFPPVRPRGWLELRMIDALPDPWWQVPVKVVSALLAAADPAETAAAVLPAAGHWRNAARHGLTHPVLAEAARSCFALAIEALADGDEGGADVVAAFADRYVSRGRCPADDRLAAWGRRGETLLEGDLEAAPTS
jgi:glutamate--cysteine ligase